MTEFQLRLGLLIALIAGLTVLAYRPGLGGPFLHDDHPNITGNAAVQIDRLSWDGLAQAASSGRAGPLGRPLAMASFAVNHAFTGLASFPYKLTNLLIHLGTGLLVGLLTQRLLSRFFLPSAPRRQIALLASLTAGLWLLHPLQLTNVLYIVQRMNALAGLFTLASLICYIDWRFAAPSGNRITRSLRLAGVAVFGLCAILSKENGILLIAYLAVLETFAAGRGGRPDSARLDRRLLILGATAALLLTALILIFNGWQDAYAARDFSLEQRLLTESRALAWYLWMLLAPDLTQLGLVHDHWQLSRGLLTPPSTLLSILGLLLLALLAWWRRHRQPELLFALLWFLAGHSLESGVVPLALVYEHRNYLPLLGPLLALVLLLYRATAPRWRLGLILAAMSLAACASLTGLRAANWSSEARWIETQSRHHPDSPGAQFLHATLLAQQAIELREPRRARRQLQLALSRFDRAIALAPENGATRLARSYYLARAGQPILNEDLQVASRAMASAQLSTMDQTAALIYCRQIRRGDIPWSGPPTAALFAAALANPRLAPEIRAPLQSCTTGLEPAPAPG